MIRLDSVFDNDTWTHDGEAGAINHIFERIGVGSRTAVEFGAGDGLSWSNTARLWRDEGWKALLIEPDPQRFAELEGNALPFDTICRQGFVQPDGPDSIAEILQDYGDIDVVDFMSIDIDGNDHFILQSLACRPRVLVVEFNPTVPPHVDIRQAQLGESFGASLLAIVRLGQSRGYRFVGATRCNAFFVVEEEAAPFDGYETDINVLFPREQYTYAVSDYQGRVALVGQPLPWDAKEPYVLPLDASTNVMPVTNSPQHLRRGFESLWGSAWWLTPDGLSAAKLEELLGGTRPRLVCIDLSTAAPQSFDWMYGSAAAHRYRAITYGPVLGLIAEEIQ